MSSETPEPPGDPSWNSVFGLYRFMSVLCILLAVVMTGAVGLIIDADATAITALSVGVIVVLCVSAGFLYRSGLAKRNWMYRWCRFKKPLEKAATEMGTALMVKGIVTSEVTSFPGFTLDPWIPVTRLDFADHPFKLEFSVLKAGSMGSVAVMRTGPFMVMLQGIDETNREAATEIMHLVDRRCDER